MEPLDPIALFDRCYWGTINNAIDSRSVRLTWGSDSIPECVVREFAARLLEMAVAICDEQADKIDGRLPDAHGGRFAKKFAANGVRGIGGLIRIEIERVRKIG